MNRSTNLIRGASGLLFALFLATLAGPAAADHDRPGVTLFGDVHFRGQSEDFYGDVADLRGSFLGNDRASSVAVAAGCQVTLYRDAGFRGPSMIVRHDLSDLRGTWLGNDEVSSLRLDCGDRRGGRRWRGRDEGYRDEGYRDEGYRDGGYRDDGYRRGGRHAGGVTVFADADFRGRRESFAWDDPDLRDNPIRQDTISSVSVAPGCRAVLFSDVGFRGRATVLTGGVADLRTTGVGNDRVSSIQVDCRRRR